MQGQPGLHSEHLSEKFKKEKKSLIVNVFCEILQASLFKKMVFWGEYYNFKKCKMNNFQICNLLPVNIRKKLCLECVVSLPCHVNSSQKKCAPVQKEEENG